MSSQSSLCPSCTDLMQSYFVYSAILAIKLLALAPLAAVMCNPEKVQRANVSDLKNLTPFWLVAAFYITTSPERNTALTLLRCFVLARFVAALGYVKRLPKMATELAFFVSFSITAYMSGYVVFTKFPCSINTMACLIPNDELMQSYIFYSAMLILKLLALVPLASIVDNPEKVRKANVNDLKNLTPFWLLAGLYMTTSPETMTAIILMRSFVIARFVAALGYVLKLPRIATDSAMFVSHIITGFMGTWVIYKYRKAL
ncbi:unnamed protein product [Chilo suppressalis]|uniref:Microsomal glutathione S-transferase 1 n=1 Tax=Chilo suppressalis TaxID=168631 RepID=A0ABN8AUY1_CHISP|nr:unnamed protein product [Chilo suppressalis]